MRDILNGTKRNHKSKGVLKFIRVTTTNNNNNIYYLQLGCHPVAVVILHVHKY